jgi:bleomycin hydrolase
MSLGQPADCGLSPEALLHLEDNLRKAKKGRNCLISRTARAVPLSLVVFNSDLQKPRHFFPSQALKSELPVVNQRSSGRCWLFAGLNLLRHPSAVKMGRPKDFELSGAYLMFFDKLEKAALFLENVWQLRDQPVTNRALQFLLQTPTSDGGQFSMFLDLVEKYGCVPTDAMPDSLHAGNTRELNDVLNSVLRYFAAQIRQAETAEQKKQVVWQALKIVYNLLSDTLGPVPHKFPIVQAAAAKSFTPQEFYRALEPTNLNEFVTLISVPQEDRPFYKTYVIAGLGSMVGGRDVRYLNVPLKVMKKAVVDAIDANHRVWFGSDIHKCKHDREAILDSQAFEWKTLLGKDLQLPRAQRLQYHLNSVNHAMNICAYHRDPTTGEIQSFRVENSWGPTFKDGFLDMTSEWFDDFVFECVVPPVVLSQDLRNIWQSGEDLVLPVYDPLGVLLGECCAQR